MIRITEYKSEYQPEIERLYTHILPRSVGNTNLTDATPIRAILSENTCRTAAFGACSLRRR